MSNTHLDNQEVEELYRLFEDIKLLYRTAGVKGQPVTFIFTDAEVKDEGFLEYIKRKVDWMKASEKSVFKERPSVNELPVS